MIIYYVKKIKITLHILRERKESTGKKGKAAKDKQEIPKRDKKKGKDE